MDSKQGKLQRLAAEVFDAPAEADGWLNRPHPMLNGQTPLEHAATETGERRTIDILIALKYGGVV